MVFNTILAVAALFAYVHAAAADIAELYIIVSVKYHTDTKRFAFGDPHPVQTIARERTPQITSRGSHCFEMLDGRDTVLHANCFTPPPYIDPKLQDPDIDVIITTEPILSVYLPADRLAETLRLREGTHTVWEKSFSEIVVLENGVPKPWSAPAPTPSPAAPPPTPLELPASPLPAPPEPARKFPLLETLLVALAGIAALLLLLVFVRAWIHRRKAA